MTLLYQSTEFAKHQTGAHPECPERSVRIAAKLSAAGLDKKCRQPHWSPVERKHLSRVHDATYIEQVETFAARGGGHIEADTVVSRDSYAVAISAAGAVCDAVRRVLEGPEKSALCLVRPPGHHARKNAAMGFCLFNNIAVGARLAVDQFAVDRVLVVDWDVHHGNGTQEAFWNVSEVAFYSIHRWPFYPGSGADDEIGAGRGLGTICNQPVRMGTARKDYLSRFTNSLGQFADRMRPQLILLSAGFDGHRQDPIGSLGLETEDFATLTRFVQAVANQHAGGRIVSTLEGGYNLNVLPECVAQHLETLLEEDHVTGDREEGKGKE